MKIASFKEWLDSWGQGSNWSDISGKSVPIDKESLRTLLDQSERMRDALLAVRDRALMAKDIVSGAEIATIADDALEGVA